VRACGEVSDLRGLTGHDHVCWVYDEISELVSIATEFLAEGLRSGEQVVSIGGHEGSDIARALRAQAELEQAARGAVSVTSLAAIYGPDDVVDPASQVSVYVDATRQALRAGFTGSAWSLTRRPFWAARRDMTRSPVTSTSSTAP